jgi:FkbM family methyltransferase
MSSRLLCEQLTRRTASPWLIWDRLPEALRAPTRVLIALARRTKAHTTPLPPGKRASLPDSAVELRTRYGGFWFDGADRKMTPWIRRHATWEQDVLRLLSSVVRPGMTVVDVGANIGFHTVVLSRLTGPSGRVHAFEPHPVTLELLRANLWRHGCANTTVHACAVADHAGTLELEVDPEGLSGTHLGAGGIHVDAVTLDDALAGVPVDVMKVDVEGAEPLVLRGAARTIARSPGLLAVVEFRGHEHLDGSGPEEVLDLYESLGLTPALLHPDGRMVAATRAALLAAAQRVDTLNIVLQKAQSLGSSARPAATSRSARSTSSG